MADKLTVLVPTKNEAKNLRPCLESVRGIADEILVADSGSTDATLAIAAALGARIIEREYIDSANMKNWAIPQATHAWVLVLDADERVSEDLARAISKALRNPTAAAAAFRVRRRSFVFGHAIRYCGWQHDVLVRLFRRDTCRYDTRRVHAAVEVNAPNGHPNSQIADLDGSLLHYTYWDFGQFMQKLDRYTTLSALDLQERGVRATATRLLLRPPLRFLRQFIFRQGFRDGLPGVLVCGLAATNVFLKYAKLWVMQNGSPQPDPEAPPSPSPTPTRTRTPD